MRRIVLMFFAVLPLVVVAQNTGKKIVAILETVDKYDNVPYGIKFQVRSSLTYAISNTPGYEACDRVDISSIMGEHNFQRSGMVNSEQTKELGKMTGASYILIAEAANYSQTEIIIAAKILDVETASVIKAAEPQVSTTDRESMRNACIQIARDLFKTGETYSNAGNKPQTSAPKRIQINYQDYEVLPGDLDGTYDWDDAVSACANLIAFRKSDWYLPDSAELIRLFNRKDEIGGFSDGWYWSSTEYNYGPSAFQQNFGNEIENGYVKKYDDARVRCIRKN